MPELPEVETIVRGLRRRIVGRVISSCRAVESRVLRGTTAENLKGLSGCRITSVKRRGKLVIIHLSKGISLIFHLKMTGQLLVVPAEKSKDKHTHFFVSFREDSREFRFRDVRKFGFVCCLETKRIFEEEPLKNLGPEPLGLTFDNFDALLRGRKGRLKPLLLNQKFLAGIGNIYADEILFRSGLHPLSSVFTLSERERRRLWRAVRTVLKAAIQEKGSSLRDYRDAEGKKGNFQYAHKVYGRESLPCYRCGTTVLRLRIGGRSSSFCPRCQKTRRPVSSSFRRHAR